MSKNTWTHFVVSLALGISLAVVASLRGPSAIAQNVTTGEWTASIEQQGSGINLTFGKTNEIERTRDKGNRHQFGQTYEFAELGLTREQVMKGGPVSFTLAREAGTIACEGSFQNGKGSGTFRFSRNPACVAGMKSRGFDFETQSKGNRRGLPEDKVFAAAALNVTTALADDLLSANFGKLQVEDLFKAAIFKIDSAFMREMKATGFPNMGMEDLVKARIF